MVSGQIQMKVKYEIAGGHVHCRVFTRQLPTITWVCCGELCFSLHEWKETVAVSFECGGFEVEENKI